MKKASREQWKQKQEARGAKLEAAIQEKIESAVIKEVVDEAADWVMRIKDACRRDLHRIEATYDQLEPAADPVAVRCLTQARKSVDDVMRRSLNLPDSPQKVEHSGSVVVFSAELQAEARAAWAALQKKGAA